MNGGRVVGKHTRYNQSEKGRARNLKYEWKRRFRELLESITRREKLVQEVEEQLMQKKDDIELARSERVKILRSLTRLKYSIMADREINDILTESMLDFDNALQNGELKQISVGEMLDAYKKY